MISYVQDPKTGEILELNGECGFPQGMIWMPHYSPVNIPHRVEADGTIIILTDEAVRVVSQAFEWADKSRSK